MTWFVTGSTPFRAGCTNYGLIFLVSLSLSLLAQIQSEQLHNPKGHYQFIRIPEVGDFFHVKEYRDRAIGEGR